MKLLLCVTVGFLVFSASYAMAFDPTNPMLAAGLRYITVAGEADEQVAPDQAIISLSLVNKDKDLNAAKQANDTLAQKLVAITTDFKIPKDKVSTSGIYISPEYEYDNKLLKQVFKDYTVNRSLRITVDKLEIQERLLSAIVEVKVDEINDVEFTLSDPKAHENELQIKAVENAKIKADALAKAAGATLGAPIAISAEGSAIPIMPRPMMRGGMMAMADSAAAPSVAPSLPGLLKLQENVSVTFALQ